MKYLALGIVVILLLGGGLYLWQSQNQTQTSGTPSQVQSQPTTKTNQQTNDKSDLTTLDRDLVELETLDTNFKKDVDSISTQTTDIQRAKLSLDKSLEGYDKTTDLEEKILDIIQVDIDKNKAMGKNVLEMEATIKESRRILISDQSKLDTIQKAKLTAKTKNDFLAIYNLFVAIRSDLTLVRKDISNLSASLDRS